jgi:hypothetical protein
MNWNIPPADEVLGDRSLTLAEAQELLLTTYVEEQDKWNKDVAAIEQDIMAKEKQIRLLFNGTDKWLDKLLSKLHIKPFTPRQKSIAQLRSELDRLHSQYLVYISKMPNVDRYELGMFDGKLFKGK